MRITRLLSVFLTASLLSSHLSADVDGSVTVNEILRKHFEAMGGPTNWNYVESIRLVGTIEREGETYDLVIVKKRPNQIRATVTVPIPGDNESSIQMIRAHDGKQAWSGTRMSGSTELRRTPLSRLEAEELLTDAGVLPMLVKLWRSGAEIQIIEDAPNTPNECIAMRVTPDNNSRHYIFYLSSETFKTHSYVTCVGESNTTTTFSDYHLVDGVLFPVSQTIQSIETGESVITTKSVEIGVGIYEEYFEPESAYRTADIVSR